MRGSGGLRRGGRRRRLLRPGCSGPRSPASSRWTSSSAGSHAVVPGTHTPEHCASPVRFGNTPAHPWPGRALRGADSLYGRVCGCDRKSPYPPKASQNTDRMRRGPHRPRQRRSPVRMVPRGLRRITRYHTAITNWAGPPGPGGPDLRFRAALEWLDAHGRITTCARWDRHGSGRSATTPRVTASGVPPSAGLRTSAQTAVSAGPKSRIDQDPDHSRASDPIKVSTGAICGGQRHGASVPPADQEHSLFLQPCQRPVRSPQRRPVILPTDGQQHFPNGGQISPHR